MSGDMLFDRRLMTGTGAYLAPDGLTQEQKDVLEVWAWIQKTGGVMDDLHIMVRPSADSINKWSIFYHDDGYIHAAAEWVRAQQPPKEHAL